MVILDLLILCNYLVERRVMLFIAGKDVGYVWRFTWQESAEDFYGLVMHYSLSDIICTGSTFGLTLKFTRNLNSVKTQI